MRSSGRKAGPRRPIPPLAVPGLRSSAEPRMESQIFSFLAFLLREKVSKPRHEKRALAVVTLGELGGFEENLPHFR